jgi:hypothetical protein
MIEFLTVDGRHDCLHLSARKTGSARNRSWCVLGNGGEEGRLAQ